MLCISYETLCIFLYLSSNISSLFRWVREFLNEENLGLDVLIDYLSFRLGMMRHEQRITESRTGSEEKLGLPNQNNSNNVTLDKSNGYIRMPIETGSPSLKRRSKHVAKLNMGDSKDDIHVCIMCMRAIMNNKVSNSILHFHIFYCILLPTYGEKNIVQKQDVLHLT